jgi:hypothetical protein
MNSPLHLWLLSSSTEKEDGFKRDCKFTVNSKQTELSLGHALRKPICLID